MITHEIVKPTTTSERASAPLPGPPPRRLSPARVLLFLLVVAGLTFGATTLIRNGASPSAAAVGGSPSYAPYVDVTLTPTYAFQSPAANPVGSEYLGFVVGSSATSCTPSWGGYYSLQAAATALNLDARIAQVQAQGGHPMISFGGQAGTELAVGCSSPTQLAQAYLQPIQRYHVRAIDLDIEGAALSDAAASTRRAAAIASVQRTRAAQGQPLRVWLTLPVSTSGLTADGQATLRAMIAAGVKLAGVNVLAMDFGTPAAHNLFGAISSSLYASHSQLIAQFNAASVPASSSAVWHQMGVTVMIGRNDSPDERFTISDARRLTKLVAAEGIGRVSMWSLNRDSECGSVFAQVGVLSNNCSGVTQTPLQFTRIFSHLPGTSTARSTAISQAIPVLAQAPADNPATSPYPIWQSTASYVSGFKVVWHHNIYQAKWFSQGVAPDAPAASPSTPSPWLLIGPVPASSKAPRPELLDTRHHPQWSPSAIYHEGDRVTYRGLPYLARWYTHAQPPSTTLPADPGAPWQPLYTLPGEPVGGTA